MGLTVTTSIYVKPTCNHTHWVSPKKQQPYLLWQQGSNKISKLTYGVCLKCQETIVLEDKIAVKNNENTLNSPKGILTTLKPV